MEQKRQAVKERLARQDRRQVGCCLHKRMGSTRSSHLPSCSTSLRGAPHLHRPTTDITALGAKCLPDAHMGLQRQEDKRDEEQLQARKQAAEARLTLFQRQRGAEEDLEQQKLKRARAKEAQVALT